MVQYSPISCPKNRPGGILKVLPRLRGEEIAFFTPWGPRYDWNIRGAIIRETDIENKTLRYLYRLLGEIKTNMPGKKFRWIFLGADLYGTRINGLPEDITTNYFDSLKERLDEIIPESEFFLWSEFDGEAEIHRKKIRENFGRYVDVNLLARANKTAGAMGRSSDAKKYLVERIAEAILIEETFHPIKISCVARHKDDKVDQELPRLYFLPENLQAPWMRK